MSGPEPKIMLPRKHTVAIKIVATTSRMRRFLERRVANQLPITMAMPKKMNVVVRSPTWELPDEMLATMASGYAAATATGRNRSTQRTAVRLRITASTDGQSSRQKQATPASMTMISQDEEPPWLE